MFRTPALLLAAGLTAATMGGVSLAATTFTQAPASAHGTEHMTYVGNSVTSGVYSVIATGVFTDGGSINLSAQTGLIKLGAGSITVQPKFGKMTQRFNKRTCLLTMTGSGTYKIVKGTRRYAGITGSGHFKTVDEQVNARKANGTCSTTRELAFQGAITLTGPVTLGG
jgi:hypothetical protein